MVEPWMMFTLDQGQELIDNINFEWTTINNVNGIKFTSKTDSYKYIFLPAGGRWYDATHDIAGSYGFYWSTAFNDSSTPRGIDFNSGFIRMNHDSRYRGRSIRPLAPKRPW